MRIWRGVFEEYPDITVFCFWLLSDAPYRHVETELPAFMRERGDLWPAFVNGMLDVLPSTATLVDGEEDAYKFEAARHDFFKARTRMRSWDLPLVAPENRVKYLSQVSQSFGQYLEIAADIGRADRFAAEIIPDIKQRSGHDGYALRLFFDFSPGPRAGRL